MKKPIFSRAIEKNIFLIRRHRVMLSTHLAELYRVEAKVLVQAVKRNIDRFPEDFMFQLNELEFKNLKSQVVTSSWGGIRRANPYAFTEQGVVMLSSILRSKRAIQMNIAIMRIFVKLRQIISTDKKLAYKLNQLEGKIEKHDVEIPAIFEAIHQLISVPDEAKRQIGFHKSGLGES